MSFSIRFWGVRGSIASPGVNTTVYGGNTSCVQVSAGNKTIILDAGTGLRMLGKQGASFLPKNLHLLLSHFHLDHINGLPFFQPLYQKGVTLHLYGPSGRGPLGRGPSGSGPSRQRGSFQKTISSLFSEPFFPVSIKNLPARFRFKPLGSQSFKIPPFKIISFYTNHPGQTLGYRIEKGKQSLVYLTDHEPVMKFQHQKGAVRKNSENEQRKLEEILKGADLLIHDGHFIDRDYLRFRGWGHSSWKDAVELALKCGIPRLVLFHHAPSHSDKFLTQNLTKLQKEVRKLRITLAREGMNLSL